jgi:hypothetical protein
MNNGGKAFSKAFITTTAVTILLFSAEADGPTCLLAFRASVLYGLEIVDVPFHACYKCDTAKYFTV